MKITHLAYIGPLGSKTVSGVGEFKKGEPLAVPPHKAKIILSHWPGQFAAVMPCQTCEIAAAHIKQADEGAAIIAEGNARKQADERERELTFSNEQLRAKVTDLEARVAALLAGEKSPPPAIDPANPLDEPEGGHGTGDQGADTPPQDPPTEAPKRGRPKKE